MSRDPGTSRSAVDPAGTVRRPVLAARRWRPLVLAAVLSAATVSGGCVTARNSLGTSNSPCFVALPRAAAAVRHQGRLGGVRLVTWGQLTRSSDVYQIDIKRKLAPPQKLCLVAYLGRFRHSEVLRPAGAGRAHLAIVMVLWPKNTVLDTLLVHRPPTRFGHPRIGAGG